MDGFTQYRLFLCSICCLTTAWLSLCAVHMILCKCCLIFSQGDLLEGARHSSQKLKMRVVTVITIMTGRCHLLNALQSAVFKNKPLTVSYALVGKKPIKSVSQINMNFIDLQGSNDFCICLITGSVQIRADLKINLCTNKKGCMWYVLLDLPSWVL